MVRQWFSFANSAVSLYHAGMLWKRDYGWVGYFVLQVRA